MIVPCSLLPFSEHYFYDLHPNYILSLHGYDLFIHMEDSPTRINRSSFYIGNKQIIDVNLPCSTSATLHFLRSPHGVMWESYCNNKFDSFGGTHSTLLNEMSAFIIA